MALDHGRAAARRDEHPGDRGATAGRVDDQVRRVGVRADGDAGDPGGVARREGEAVDPVAAPHVDGGLAPHGRGQGGLQHDPAGAEGHQFLVAGPVRRVLVEPVELVVLPGAARQQVRVDVRRLGVQHRAHRSKQGVRLDGLRDAGAVPVEEVPVQVVPGLPGVLLEEGDGVPPSPEHERGPQAADTATDHCNPRHWLPFASCCGWSLPPDDLGAAAGARVMRETREARDA